MTAQERIEAVSLRQINRSGGVLVTILPRNVSVWASIDRTNNTPGKVESEIVVQGEVGITVFIQKRLLNLTPKCGEYIQESNGASHTIGEVKDLGQRWQLTCSSKPL